MAVIPVVVASWHVLSRTRAKAAKVDMVVGGIPGTDVNKASGVDWHSKLSYRRNFERANSVVSMILVSRDDASNFYC